MDMDKLKEWFEVAQQFHGKDFWDDVFNDQMKAFDTKMNGIPSATPRNQSKEVEKPLSEKEKMEYPLIDVMKNDHELIIVAEVPGLNKEDLDVTIEDRHLTIKSRKAALFQEYTVIKAERNIQSFSRMIGLPNGIDINHVSSYIDSGLLIIRFPRTPTRSKKVAID